MTERGARATVKPGTVVAVFLDGDLLLVLVGVATIWFGVAGNVAYWDGLERGMVIGLGLVVTTMFVAVGAGLIRYNVLGRPRVRIEQDGLWIGADRLRWDEIDPITGATLYGVPYLVAGIDIHAIKRLGIVDRTMMRLAPRAAKGRRSVWITEQQIGTSAETALRRVPSSRTVG